MNTRIEEFINFESANDKLIYNDSYYHDDYHDDYADTYRDEYSDVRYDDAPGGLDY